MHRPETTEYASFYAGYVNHVPDGEIINLLQSEHDRTGALLRSLTPEQASFRYAEGKWSVKELAGHMIDSERTFGYRAQCFARKDPAHLPGFDQEDYGRSSNADERTLAALVDEHDALRLSHVLFFKGLDEAAWSQRGIASDCEFTVRALAYIIVGHEIHHRTVIEERYINAS